MRSWDPRGPFPLPPERELFQNMDIMSLYAVLTARSNFDSLNASSHISGFAPHCTFGIFTRELRESLYVADWGREVSNESRLCWMACIASSSSREITKQMQSINSISKGVDVGCSGAGGPMVVIRTIRVR